jgi:hypothetical protein
MLRIHFLKAQNIRIEFGEDRAERLGACLEPIGLVWRPVEAFNVKSSEAE